MQRLGRADMIPASLLPQVHRHVGPVFSDLNLTLPPHPGDVLGVSRELIRKVLWLELSQ